MKVSLNWIKKYIDIPENITNEQIASDLTLKTVEVEDVVDTSKKFHDIIVGKILEVKEHPNADTLRICMVDIGEDEPKQIVCGGSNLYNNEMVVVCKPGAEVYWHGEGDLVKISETKMRGESSYGMICGAEEVFLENFFPPKSEHEIVDLSELECYPGQNISDLVFMNDVVLEIDNKSLTNRPDLWGHYGIARELSVIYDVPLKPLKGFSIDSSLPKYDIEILESDKCKRYSATVIDNLEVKDSPLWMKSDLIKCGMRPINAIVDITNYVMLATGEPTHAFDETHVKGSKIIVRNAKENEKLLLLDNNEIDLTTDDLVIADTETPLALAGIRGGKKDSILESTTKVLLEVANFDKSTIRKTDKRFAEKTDASIRYEKGLDIERVDEGISLALNLFNQIYPSSKITMFNDVNLSTKEELVIDVPETFLNERLGKVLDKELITKVLTGLGYKVNYEEGICKVVVPSYRATGDVTVKDDVMGDLVRIIGFNSFPKKPLSFNTDKAVLQKKVLLDNRLKEYLSYRCGFYEIITYPWINEKYIDATGIDKNESIKLSSPPSPEESYLRKSLVPGLLETIVKNTRYFDSFKIYEMTEVFTKGEYHESSIDETLPIHNTYLSGAIVGKDAKSIFLETKGVLESISSFTHMESIKLVKGDKPSWADVNAYLDITLNDKVIGKMGLVSVRVLNECKIKRVNVCIFEINSDELIPFESRTNKFTELPLMPDIEKDLSLIMDESVKYEDIYKIIKNRVKSVNFIEEYKGSQIESGKKSITIKLILNNEGMTSEEINKKIDNIVVSLNKLYGVKLRIE